MPQSSEHIPNIPMGITIVVIFPSASVTVRVIFIPSFTKVIILPSNSILPPVPPPSELNRLSAISLDN